MEKFSSFNGFSRPALAFGVPIVFFSICIVVMLISFFLGIILAGILYACIIPLIIAGLLFYIRLITEQNINALELLQLNLKSIIFRLKYAKNMSSISLGTSAYSFKERKENVKNFFSPHRD